MPNWKFHDKWAEKMEINKKISNLVNVHEDKIWGFEAIRKGNKIPNLQDRLDFMRQKGSEYVKTWALHIILDQIEDYGMDWFDADANVMYYSLEKAKECVEQVVKQIGVCDEVDFTKRFVLNNLDEILQDIVNLLIKNGRHCSIVKSKVTSYDPSES